MADVWNLTFKILRPVFCGQTFTKAFKLQLAALVIAVTHPTQLSGLFL